MKEVNECTQCGWQGNDEEKVDIMQPDGMGLLTCPECGCGEFYVEPSVKKCTIPHIVEQLPPQICYKTNEPCKYNCQGLCKESC